MKKFLANLCIFALPIVAVGFAADIWLSRSISKSRSFAHGEVETWQKLQDGKMDLDIAIYGSSRAWTQIDTEILENELGGQGFNFGINAHNFWLEYLRHRMLIDQNKAPKIIIQALDVQTLAKNKDLVNPDQFLPYMFWDQRFEDYTYDYNGFDWEDYNLPLMRYYGKRSAVTEAAKMTWFPEKDVPRRHKGYQPKVMKWTKDLENAQRNLKDRTVRFHEPSIQYFEDFLAECNAKGIKVVLVYCPEYIEGQSLFVNRKKEVMPLYERLSKKYNVPFYDYSAHEISYQKKYFYNATHLNKEGAERFSADLAKRIKNDPRLSY